MWYWLRKNTHDRTFLTSLIITVVVHVVVIAWFFFFFKDRSSQLSLSVMPDLLNKNIEFVFALTPKRTPPVSGKSITAKTSSHAKAKLKKEAAKAVKPGVAFKDRKAPAKKVVPKKPVPKKELPKKKEAVVKPIEEKKVEPKPITPEPMPEPAKPEPPIIKEPPAEIERPEVIEFGTQTSDEVIQQQIGIHDRALIEEYMALQQEIVTHWAPPPGIACESVCLVSVFVDWQGAIKNITVDKTSGILMFDTAARAAVSRITFPRWTWGKTLTITFNQ